MVDKIDSKDPSLSASEQRDAVGTITGVLDSASSQVYDDPFSRESVSIVDTVHEPIRVADVYVSPEEHFPRVPLARRSSAGSVFDASTGFLNIYELANDERLITVRNFSVPLNELSMVVNHLSLGQYDERIRNLMFEFPDFFRPVASQRIGEYEVQVGSPAEFRTSGSSRYILIPVYIIDSERNVELLTFYSSNSHGHFRRNAGFAFGGVHKGRVRDRGSFIPLISMQEYRGECFQAAALSLDSLLDSVVVHYESLFLERNGEPVQIMEFGIIGPGALPNEEEVQYSMYPRGNSAEEVADRAFDFTSVENQPRTIHSFWQARTPAYGEHFRMSALTASGEHYIVYAITNTGIFPQYVQRVGLQMNRAGSVERGIVYLNEQAVTPIIDYEDYVPSDLPDQVRVYHTASAGGVGRVRYQGLDFVNTPSLRASIDPAIHFLFRGRMDEAREALEEMMTEKVLLNTGEVLVEITLDEIQEFVNQRIIQLTRAFHEYMENGQRLNSERIGVFELEPEDISFFENYVRLHREDNQEIDIDFFMFDRIMRRAEEDIRFRVRYDYPMPNVDEASPGIDDRATQVDHRIDPESLNMVSFNEAVANYRLPPNNSVFRLMRNLSEAMNEFRTNRYESQAEVYVTIGEDQSVRINTERIGGETLCLNINRSTGIIEQVIILTEMDRYMISGAFEILFSRNQRRTRVLDLQISEDDLRPDLIILDQVVSNYELLLVALMNAGTIDIIDLLLSQRRGRGRENLQNRLRTDVLRSSLREGVNIRRGSGETPANYLDRMLRETEQVLRILEHEERVESVRARAVREEVAEIRREAVRAGRRDSRGQR